MMFHISLALATELDALQMTLLIFSSLPVVDLSCRCELEL